MGVKYDQLEDFQKILKLSTSDVNGLAEACTKDLAGRLLAYVIPDTPVGKNRGKNGSIKGGTLRRGWTAKTHQEAEKGSGLGKNPRQYVNNEVDVKKSGNVYTIDIINPVEYAMYVEYGHRTRGGKGFVKGQYMMTNSIKRLEPQVEQFINKKVQKFFNDSIGDKS